MKAVLFSALLLVLMSESVRAQSITPAADGTDTIATPQGDRIDISGGQLSRDGANLFHSFSQFGLDANQTATFLSNPNIQNILARINGGNPSIINGLLQVSGGNSNLFLMNPAGIVFGQSASLNVPASFTATTATGIGFSNGFFNANGNNFADLIGNPSAYSFANLQPGAIVNLANLSVGQNLTFLGGTVLSTGELSARNGQVTIASVPGQNLVQLNVAGSPLGLEFQPISAEAANGVSIAQLLTGGTVSNASGITVNSDGTVQLNGSGIGAGDVAVRNTIAQSANLSAVHDLKLIESQIQTRGNLNLFADRTVFVRDSVATPFFAWAGGNLTIQGNQGIDILALNHVFDRTPFVSGGTMRLISDGIVSGDAHFQSDRGFSILNRQGKAGTFISLYDPIISVDGSVEIGDYQGAPIKIEATGNIQTGNIVVDTPDTALVCNGVCSPDIEILRTQPAIILRAGVSLLEKPGPISQGQFLAH